MFFFRALQIAATMLLLSSPRDIHEVVRRGELAEVKSMLSKNPEWVSSQDNNGRYPLHIAVAEGHLELAAFLIGQGAEADVKDNDGWTPLTVACLQGSKELAALLLDNGADINAEDIFGTTCLSRVAQRGNLVMAQFLVGRGADVHARNPLGMSPLFWSVHSGNLDVLKTLIGSGADLKSEMNDKTTLLHLATIKNKSAFVEYIIENGVNVNVRKDFQVTPLHLAAVFGHEDMVHLLVEKGADPNAWSDYAGTPLHQAMAGGQEEIVDLLLNRGAEKSPRKFPRLKGKYLGMKPPGSDPEIFAPGILLHVHWPHSRLNFSRDGNEMYWSAAAFFGDFESIWYTKQDEDGWPPPRIAPFSVQEDYIDGGPCLSPDGKRLYFHSSRPVNEGEESKGVDIWFVEREEDGWGEPQHLGSPVNTDGIEAFVSFGESGNMYFQSRDREGGYGGFDLYVSRAVNGDFSKPENLGEIVNSRFGEVAPFITPDESYLIFHSNRPGGTSPEYELYICFKKQDGIWTEPVNFGGRINVGRTTGGNVTPDGKYLFFNSARHGSRAYYWVDAAIIGALGPKD